MDVDADFPGGNIIVDRVVGNSLYVRQDLRDTEGHWFYWYFRVRGAAGRTLTVHYTQRDVIGVRGPAVSTDGGDTWQWLGRQHEQPVFSYAVPAGCDEVRFSVGIPYLAADLDRFLSHHEDHPKLARSTLCTSRSGRTVERLNLGLLHGSPDWGLLLTCRHHACEAAASYVLEGAMAAMLAGDDSGAWLRENAAAFVVPFVDKDGVEEGDQGKNRSPRDHNRDYAGASIYPEVRAIREQVPAWCGETPTAAIDLHCPGLRGKYSHSIYMVGSVDEENWRRQQLLGSLLEDLASGPLPYRQADSLPYGEGWNTTSNYSKGRSSVAWARRQAAVHVATTLEIPYADVHGTAVTADAARALGRDLLQAVCAYFRSVL